MGSPPTIIRWNFSLYCTHDVVTGKQSKTQQLLLVLNTIHKVIHANKAVDIIPILQEDLDTISHDKLLGKLWSVGIRDKLWHCFKVYLNNTAKIKNKFSSMLPVISSVPQGSIYLHLVIHSYFPMNDLSNCASSSTSYLLPMKPSV